MRWTILNSPSSPRDRRGAFCSTLWGPEPRWASRASWGSSSVERIGFLATLVPGVWLQKAGHADDKKRENCLRKSRSKSVTTDIWFRKFVSVLVDSNYHLRHTFSLAANVKKILFLLKRLIAKDVLFCVLERTRFEALAVSCLFRRTFNFCSTKGPLSDISYIPPWLGRTMTGWLLKETSCIIFSVS